MNPTQTTWLKVTALLAILLTLTGITATSIIDNAMPKMQATTLHLQTPASPDAADPLRIAFLSDLHFNGALESARQLEQLLTKVINAQPDVILLGGDYSTSVTNEADLRALRADFAEIFSKTEGIPVVAVLGNHEAWTALPRWRAALQSEGIAVHLDHCQAQIQKLHYPSYRYQNPHFCRVHKWNHIYLFRPVRPRSLLHRCLEWI